MTPAVEAARRAGISFELHEYEGVDVGDGDYATAVAAALERPAAQLFKTLVASVDGTLSLFVVPADRRLDLRAAGKRAQLAGKAEAERATGYVVGGISPLGLRSGCLRQSMPRSTSGRRFSSAQAVEACRSSSRLPI
jgi:Cys-tRNA(Pro)/Cys-tRNA(Cys) deacylase